MEDNVYSEVVENASYTFEGSWRAKQLREVQELKSEGLPPKRGFVLRHAAAVQHRDLDIKVEAGD